MGAVCDHFKIKVRTRVRAVVNLVCVRATRKTVATHLLKIGKGVLPVSSNTVSLMHKEVGGIHVS